jgi:hypothetical protein
MDQFASRAEEAPLLGTLFVGSDIDEQLFR